MQLEDELQRAWAEIERLRTKLGALERERQPNDEDGSRAPRYWTPEEHTLFVEAVQRYGWKDVKAISQHVGTRNPTQVRTHAQKLLLRQQKEQAGVMQTQQNGRELPPLPPGMVMPQNNSGDSGGNNANASANANARKHPLVHPRLRAAKAAQATPAHRKRTVMTAARRHPAARLRSPRWRCRDSTGTEAVPIRCSRGARMHAACASHTRGSAPR